MTLLQISSEDGFTYLIIAVFCFFIGVFITRWLFKIDTIVEHMQQQTRILAKMAKQQGVPENELRSVLGLKAEPIADNADNEIADIIIRYGRKVAITEAQARRNQGVNDALDYVDNLIAARRIVNYQK